MAALAVEFVLLKETLSAAIARKLLIADMVFGASAGAVLVIGLLRVFFFEKRSEEHTSELQSLMRISYAVFCLKKNKICVPSHETHTQNIQPHHIPHIYAISFIEQS